MYGETERTVLTPRGDGDFQTLGDILRRRAVMVPDMLACTFVSGASGHEAAFSYLDLDMRARAIAASLQRRKLAGERALLLFDTGPGFVVAFFACLYAGVIAVPVYPPHRNRRVERVSAIAQDCTPAIVLFERSMTARVSFCRQQTGELSGVEWLDIDDVLIEQAEEWHERQTHTDDLAMLQYTSGSTGAPKGVQLSHSNILYNSERLRIAFEHNADSVVVVWLPLFHDMGLIGNLLQPLYAGCRSVLMPPMHFLKQPIRWLHTISRHQATTSGGPNFAFDLCVDAITPEQRATLDLSTWRVAFNGAERVRFQTIERFSAYFAPAGFRRTAFYPCYGLAEGTLIVTGGRVAEPPRFAAPAGKERTDTINGRRSLFVGCGSPLPGHDVRIVDPETGLEQPDTTVGEIWIAGKDVASGYWRQSPTEHDFAARMHGQGDGTQFFRTGDLGFVADHELYITGRRKDLIIINGRNHYPEDLEATVARTDPNFLANGCVAVSLDEDGKELVYLLVEVQSGLIQDLVALRDAIDRELAFEHEIVPQRVYFVRPKSIPRTSSGKVQRHRCQAMIRDGDVPAIASV